MQKRRKRSRRGKHQPISERYGREINFATGEGMNLDTLFLKGRVDADTYSRYLREFEEQQRHGTGHKAYARVVDGKIYYDMSEREDYFYRGMVFDDMFFCHPFEDICAIADEHLPLPDFRNSVVRELPPFKGNVSNEGQDDWGICGTLESPMSDSDFEEKLDRYLESIEDAP